VGLHRGGIADPQALQRVLDSISANPRLEFSGLMGYDPHVVKMPGIVGGPEAEFVRVLDRYRAFRDVALAHNATDPARPLTLNAAGSPTYALWRDVDGLANELSIGSGFVKPLDFDVPTLSEHVPGLFIATPILKASQGVQVAGLGAVNNLWPRWDPNRAQSFFTYGGYWKARPVSPPGLIDNPLFGHSTNQEMLNGAAGVELAVDDFVFMRPTQSEFVMLQFGDLVIVRNGEIVDTWPVLSQTGTI
jgi:D-serine deaminase-like pyridoxal phosphate-dependent protein